MAHRLQADPLTRHHHAACRFRRQAVSRPCSRDVCVHSVPVHRIPAQALSSISAANDQWLQHCVSNPLIDEATQCRYFLVGTCPYAPLQWELLDAVLQQCRRPAWLAMEQPLGAAAGLMLPYPAYIEAMLEHFEGNLPLHALDPSMHGSSARVPGSAGPSAATTGALQEVLARTAITAAVGGDCIDPFEVFGYYPGLDFVQQPQHVAQVLARFGFLAGAEYAAAVQVGGLGECWACCAPCCAA